MLLLWGSWNLILSLAKVPVKREARPTEKTMPSSRILDDAERERKADKGDKERGRNEERDKKRPRMSSDDDDDEHQKRSRDARRMSKDAEGRSGNTESSKRESKPGKDADAKKRGAEEAEHGKAPKKNRRTHDDHVTGGKDKRKGGKGDAENDDDETPKKNKGEKAAVRVTPEKEDAPRCMQGWVVCKLWIVWKQMTSHAFVQMSMMCAGAVIDCLNMTLSEISKPMLSTVA